jgi:hypothetical protein
MTEPTNNAGYESPPKVLNISQLTRLNKSLYIDVPVPHFGGIKEKLNYSQTKQYLHSGNFLKRVSFEYIIIVNINDDLSWQLYKNK